jgi:hypothetical protein
MPQLEHFFFEQAEFMGMRRLEHFFFEVANESCSRQCRQSIRTLAYIRGALVRSFIELSHASAATPSVPSMPLWRFRSLVSTPT